MQDPVQGSTMALQDGSQKRAGESRWLDTKTAYSFTARMIVHSAKSSMMPSSRTKKRRVEIIPVETVSKDFKDKDVDDYDPEAPPSPTPIPLASLYATKMPEFFHVDRAALSTVYQQAPTDALQRLELRYLRSYAANCGSAALGVAATAKTLGAAWPLPVYSARMARVAAVKLELVQLQLAARAVQLHVFGWKDAAHATGSLVAGQLVGDLLPLEIGGGGAEDLAGPDQGGAAVRDEVVNALPGEIAQKAYLAATSGPPPKKCPRPRRRRFQRLRCAECSLHFDTSYVEWIHCCQCRDRYDICGDCARTTEHSPGHQLYRMRGDQPSPQTSKRGVLGVKVKCSGCHQRLSGDMYTCEDCVGRFDVCLDCYGQGHWCGKHTAPLCRQRL